MNKIELPLIMLSKVIQSLFDTPAPYIYYQDFDMQSLICFFLVSHKKPFCEPRVPSKAIIKST